MSAAPRVLVFDAVGTLIYPDPPVACAYWEAGRRHGSRLSLDDVAQRLKPAMQSAFQVSHEVASGAAAATTEQGERRRWRRVVAQVFDDVPSAGADLFEALWRHFSHPEHWRVYDDVAPCWSALAGRRLVLAIASNFDARLAAICRALAPLDACPHVLWSASLGYSKPRAEFYDAALARLSASAAETMMIGDDPDNDYHGALAAGWSAVLVDRSAQASRLPNRIQDLRELPDLLAFADGATA